MCFFDNAIMCFLENAFMLLKDHILFLNFYSCNQVLIDRDLFRMLMTIGRITTISLIHLKDVRMIFQVFLVVRFSW